MKNLLVIFLFALGILTLAIPSKAGYYRHASSPGLTTALQDTLSHTHGVNKRATSASGWQSVVSAASGILGVATLFGLGGSGWVLMSIPLGIAAIVFGIIGVSGRKKLRALSIAGIILGGALLLLIALVILVALPSFT